MVIQEAEDVGSKAAVVTKARRAEIVIMKPKEITMIQHTAFADALDAVEHLDPDAQMELIAVLNRRLAERCLLYTSPSPRDGLLSRMPSSA